MTTPHPTGADPKPGRNPGYSEEQPRDREDARQPAAEPKRDPEDGGLDRAPGDDPDPADG